MDSQKTANPDTWKSFFRLQSVMIPAMGLFQALIIWRWPDSVTVHPSFGRAVLIAMVMMLGTFLIAIIQRSILRSNAGMAAPYIFSAGARPQHPTAPLLEVLTQMTFVLVVVGLVQILFALQFRNSITRKKQKLLPSLADAELDAQSL